MTKYELIDSITVSVDALVDMRGTEKCRTALEIVGKLAALKTGLQRDDQAAEDKIRELEARLRALQADDDDGDTETIDGVKYRIGATGGKET